MFYLDDLLAGDTTSLWHIKLKIYEANAIKTLCLLTTSNLLFCEKLGLEYWLS